MFDRLLAVVAPHQCIGCRVNGPLWCVSCRAAAAVLPARCYRCQRLSAAGRTCGGCRRSSWVFSATAATTYDGQAKRLIWKLKFDGARAAADVAAALMAERCKLPAEAILVPIPTATGRVRRRSYDQAVLLARRLAVRTALPCVSLLRRSGQAQQHTATRGQRLAQLQDAFSACHPLRVRGAHVVLIDDILTTGATVEAAALALKKAGARRVTVAVFAQA